MTTQKHVYFAALKPFRAPFFLLVAFEYMAERDTFVKNTEFVAIPAAKAKRMSEEIYHLCRDNDRCVYDQDGIRVAHLKSLRVGAMAQAPKRRR